MATLVRAVERPAFLDPSDEGQLSFGAALAPAVPVRERGRDGERVPLSERLRGERARGSAAACAPVATQGGTAPSGEATLDELLVGAWEGLSARHSVTCPVCTATMEPRAGALGGACGDCGSQLR